MFMGLILLKSMPAIVAQGLLLFGFILVISKVMDFIAEEKKYKKSQIERNKKIELEKKEAIRIEKEKREATIIPKAIDLGLSLPILWASENLCAQKIHIQGKWFPWCNVQPSFRYKEVVRDTNTLKFGMLKQIFNNDDGSFSSNDKYDAATNILGYPWRTPKDYEFQCLIDECKWELIRELGVQGWRITGPNGNSIWLPMEQDNGFVLYYPLTEYWTSSPSKEDEETLYIKVPTLNARMVRITQEKDSNIPICKIEDRFRIYNCYIRPIQDK